jgi:hypothetical protein
MNDGLKARQMAALDKALRPVNAAQLDDVLHELRALGYATTSEEIPESARPGRPITDFFGATKGALRTVALLPRQLWPEYRYAAGAGREELTGRGSRVRAVASGPRKPKTGTSMGWTSESPARKKRRAEARKAQEARWVAKARPLKVYYRDPITGEGREQPPQR